jgi:hypothetical protein
MIAYASRTGTKRNLEALRSAGWRLMVSARGVLRTEGFPYALDNGAWTAFQKKESFDGEAFKKAVAMLGDEADFIVLPDIVAGGRASLDMSVRWWHHLRTLPGGGKAPLLVPVQNGMQPHDLRCLVGPHLGIFIGGTTDWKLSTMRQWGDFGREHSAYVHVGRVNTARRIHACIAAGAHSFDGSGWSRYGDTIHAGELARQQTDIEPYIARAA